MRLKSYLSAIAPVFGLLLIGGCDGSEPVDDGTCGDGILQVGEQCEDGNTVGGDGCSADCSTIEACGNGVVDVGELCDDGNTVSGDGCSDDCQSQEACGNGAVDMGELCDDGNTVDGDGCSADCLSNETCGNTVVDVGEVCDDGNTVGGDGCSADCLSNETCGDGSVDVGEQCDDGNTVGGDGCSADCLSDETCGNNIVDPGEQCDDGNTVGGDGCSADCVSDETCGNGELDAAEVCDDGNTVDGDGCSADCLSDETCGNNIVDPGEQCDDGNTADNDGCSATCQTECAGATEICDGLDNDCDTTVDEGCPSVISLAAGTPGSLFGNLTGGSAFSDDCGSGEALTGLVGTSGGNIDQVSGRCGLLTVVADQTATPYSYSVAVGSGATLPTHGSNFTTPYTIACPADAVVVGISGEAGAGGLTDVTLHCAPLLVTGTIGSFGLAYGTITTVTVSGSNTSTPFSELLVEPAVANLLQGRAGAWVDAIGLGSSNPTLVLN